MPDSSSEVSSSSAAFPRLQISDLLVLTLTTAFGLAWVEALGDGDPPDTSQWAGLVSLFDATLVGVLFFGFAVLAREIHRGRPLASLSPGHWWFLVAAPQLLIGLTHQIVAYFTSVWLGDRLGHWRTLESSISAANDLLFAALWLFAAMWIRQWPWRMVLVFKAAEQMIWLSLHGYRAMRYAGYAWPPSILSMHFFGLMGTCWVCLLASLLIAVATDIRSQRSRDWLHYLAAAVIVADSIEFFRPFGQLAVRWWQAVYLRLLP